MVVVNHCKELGEIAKNEIDDTSWINKTYNNVYVL